MNGIDAGVKACFMDFLRRPCAIHRLQPQYFFQCFRKKKYHISKDQTICKCTWGKNALSGKYS